MRRLIPRSPLSRAARIARVAAIALLLSFAAQHCRAQDTPLLSGGIGFFTSTNGGNTNYQPLIEPLIAAPIGRHLLIESRAALVETYFPNGNGYDHAHFTALTYLQGDLFLGPHLTVVGGSFLLPFNTYTERLTPIWISNFQDYPLIVGIGTMNSEIGVGGMLRGSAVSTPKYSIDYAGWFSARSSNEQFPSQRSTGGRVSLYLKQSRLEMGL